MPSAFQYFLSPRTGRAPAPGRENLVGSSRRCTVVIGDERVAAEHCRISVSDQNVVVRPEGDAEVRIGGSPSRAESIGSPLAPSYPWAGCPSRLACASRREAPHPPAVRRAPARRSLGAGSTLVAALLFALAAPLVFNKERMRRHIVRALRAGSTAGDDGLLEVQLLRGRIEITDLVVANKADFTPVPSSGCRLPRQLQSLEVLITFGSSLRARITLWTRGPRRARPGGAGQRGGHPGDLLRSTGCIGLDGEVPEEVDVGTAGST